MIGPYFFENDYRTTATVKSERYGHIITDFYLPAIKEYDLENMLFLLDSSTCRKTRTNTALLQETLSGRKISRRGDINWPLRLCDLTILDFFRATRKVVFRQINFQVLSTLKTNIRQVMAGMPPNKCQKVIENYLKRINSCNISCEGHFE